MSVAVAAFYKFIELDAERLAVLRTELETFAAREGVLGLVVLGSEGVNATVSAAPEIMERFKAKLQDLLFPCEISFKDSVAPKAPFVRFKVDLRPEIITTKDTSISAELSAGTHLTPQEWHEAMSSDPNVVLVDTRNVYETEIGAFKGAVDPQIVKFSDFGRFAESGVLPRDKKLLMYCTGGVRCEKAVPEMKRLGYENVFQLEGGILKYLEEYPAGYFEGECFVFDHRVAVDGDLQPSRTYKLCPHCGNPAREVVQCARCDTSAVVCHRCIKVSDKRTCSKNCAYHVRRMSSQQGQQVASPKA
jgi:UPF0176 protein